MWIILEELDIISKMNSRSHKLYCYVIFMSLCLGNHFYLFLSMPLRENCPNTEFFWSLFSRIWIEYGNLLRKSSYSVQIRTRKKFRIWIPFTQSLYEVVKKSKHYYNSTFVSWVQYFQLRYRARDKKHNTLTLLVPDVH